jgi:hypothetical protein
VNGANTYDIVCNGTCTGIVISGNSVSQAKTAIGIQFDPGDASNCQIFNNTISDMDWSILVGAGDNGSTSTGCVIHDNSMTNWTNWQFPTSSYHQDGVIVYNAGASATTGTFAIYNNYAYGDMGVGSPTAFLFCSLNASCLMYNNLLVNTGHTINGLIWLNTLQAAHRVYNNTIIGHNTSDLGITLGTGSSNTIHGLAVIENNIVIGVSAGISDYGTLASDVMTSNYNVWQNGPMTGAPNFVTGGETRVTLAAWQGEGFDVNSSTSSPDLNSSYSPAPTSSAIGLGANLCSLSITALDGDKSGSSRPCPSGAWTSGAYNDPSSPSSPSSPLGGTALVQ